MQQTIMIGRGPDGLPRVVQTDNDGYIITSGSSTSTPVALLNSALNTLVQHPVGNKGDAASEAAGTASSIALLRQVLSDLDGVALASVLGALDDVGSLALNSTAMSLVRRGAKEAWEVEHHFHNVERWYGAGASKALKLASKTPFALAGANDGWGAWTTLLVPTDTPAVAGSSHFDLHRVEFEDVQAGASKKASRFQIAWDTAVDGEADAITNGTYTEWISSPEKDGKARPNDILMKRLAVNTYYVFMRYWCLDEDSSGSDTKVFVGSHEYEDPDI